MTTHDDAPDLTPEQRYDERYANSSPMGMIHALRDMIASLDVEVARLTETVNRQETEFASAITALEIRVDDLEDESPTPEPDTVAVPAALVAAMGEFIRHGGAKKYDVMALEYHRWETGQET